MWVGRLIRCSSAVKRRWEVKKLLVFVGEGGSGKTTLIAELTGRYPEQFRKIVTCTSRPIRVGEVDGVDYHFLPEKYFIDNTNLVLAKKTDNGDFYGTRKVDLSSDTYHLLLTSKLTGIPRLISLGFRNVVAVRITISEELKIARMRQRGDTEETIFGRLKSDSLTVTDVALEQTPIIDLNASQTIYEKIEAILKVC